MRDSQLMQYGEFVKNALFPKDYFEKKPETMVNGGAPVDWSHLHQNWYAEGNKSLVGSSWPLSWIKTSRETSRGDEARRRV